MFCALSWETEVLFDCSFAFVLLQLHPYVPWLSGSSDQSKELFFDHSLQTTFTSLYSTPFTFSTTRTHSGLLSLSSASRSYNKHFLFMLPLQILHIWMKEALLWFEHYWSVWEIIRNSLAPKLGKCLPYFSQVFARGGKEKVVNCNRFVTFQKTAHSEYFLEMENRKSSY